MTAPSSTAVTSPVTLSGTPNTPESPAAIELHWLMLPMPNEASTQNSANAPARKGLCSPFLRYSMGPPRHAPSGPFSRYSMPSVFSANAVIMPKNAETHIQNTAPGPPMVSAVATPAMLPVPTVAARAVHMVANGETAFLLFLRRAAPEKQDKSVLRSHSPMCRSWNRQVLAVKYTPVPTSSTSMGAPQTKARTMSFSSTIFSIHTGNPPFSGFQNNYMLNFG